MERIPTASFWPQKPQYSALMEKLATGDQSRLHEIASSLVPRLLNVVESESSTISNWEQFVKQLEWMVRSQFEVLGRLSVSRRLLDQIILAKGQEITAPLQDLVYEHHSLSQDLLLLINSVEYPTWNLIGILDPSYWFSLQEISRNVGGELEFTLRGKSENPSIFIERGKFLVEQGLEEDFVKAAIQSLANWVKRAQMYEELTLYFYDAEGATESFYGFHHSLSAAVDLLGCSLVTKLFLKPLINQLRDVFGETRA